MTRCRLTESTIMAFSPPWIKNPKAVERGKASLAFRIIRKQQEEQQNLVQKVVRLAFESSFCPIEIKKRNLKF